MTYTNLKNNVDWMVVFSDDLEGNVERSAKTIDNRPDGQEGEAEGGGGKRISFHILLAIIIFPIGNAQGLFLKN